MHSISPRSVISFAALFLLLGAATARADVVILKGNDVPLTGRILKETKTTIRFRIKGLGSSSFIDIAKSRVVRFWREENTYWEYLKGEKQREKLLARLEASPTRDTGEKTEKKAAPAPSPKPKKPPKPIGFRTGSEIRRDLATRAIERLGRFVPGNPVLRFLLMLVGFAAAAGLFYVGGKVADLRRLSFSRATILSLATFLLAGLGVWAGQSVPSPTSLPAVIAGEALGWVLFSRLVAGGTFSKSVLLLSFFLAVLLLVAGGLFSIFSAL